MSSEVGPLKGREKEFKQLNDWVSKAIRNKQSTSIYISGLPGTGKTATIMRVLRSLKQRVHSGFVNCATTSTLTGLYSELLTAIGSDAKPTIASVRSAVESSKLPLVLVLDEMDHLQSKRNASLYAAFNWPQQLSHKIIIIGIANAIDLTERILSKLKLTGTPPLCTVFEPYTKEDITTILKDKLEQQEDKMDEKALELCARKVAAMSGDLRQALHIVNQTTSQSRSVRGKRAKLQVVDATSSPLPPSSSTPLPAATTPLIGCRQVLSALNGAYSTPLARARLPLQPRLLLAVCLTISANKKKSLTRTSLFAGYKRACDAVNVPPLNSDDLASAMETLQSQSFITLLKDGKLMLQVDSETARKVVCDTAMLDQISQLNL
ncbi:hypothetical protein WR25_26390 isoform A [Diploscapter pachys]|uniref:AAA+ ATPase domain-containing protein n=1 Tax=Diploscapter pachys TaxID=2018661 RepID=A0A2A2KSY0_9BILA|nr:hypothetical protein WR25_26390 isoform A [Diploscapter pachys]